MGYRGKSTSKEGDYITQMVKLAIKQAQINSVYLPKRVKVYQLELFEVIYKIC